MGINNLENKLEEFKFPRDRGRSGKKKSYTEKQKKEVGK